MQTNSSNVFATSLRRRKVNIYLQWKIQVISAAVSTLQPDSAVRNKYYGENRILINTSICEVMTVFTTSSKAIWMTKHLECDKTNKTNITSPKYSDQVN